MAFVQLRRNAHPDIASGRLAFLLQIGFAAGIGGALLAHAGSIVGIAFAPLALLIAIVLFLRAPAHYLGFCMWLWMLTPLVRRVVDWETSYNIISPVLLAPLLASALSMWAVLRLSSRLFTGSFVPFSIILGVTVYGLLLGTLQAGVASAVYAWLNWAVPICMGIHILAQSHRAQETIDATFRTMAWGTLVIGCYGVWQYFDPQPWDIYWMVMSKFTTAGLPEAQKIRVFSTLNSPAPFGYMMLAGLVILLTAGGKMRWIAGAPGLTAFLLSSVRSAWGGFVVALGIVILTSPMKQRAKFIALGGAIFILALPLLTVGPIADVVQARFGTIAGVENDKSYQDRTSFYGAFLGTAVETPFGTGLGATGVASRLTSSDNALGEYGVFDSGIMDVFFTFGWLGAIILLAVARMVFSALRAASKYSPAVTCAAIATGTAAQLVFADTLIGASGMLVFPFAALAIALAETNDLRIPRLRRRLRASAVRRGV